MEPVDCNECFFFHFQLDTKHYLGIVMNIVQKSLSSR